MNQLKETLQQLKVDADALITQLQRESVERAEIANSTLVKVWETMGPFVKTYRTDDLNVPKRAVEILQELTVIIDDITSLDPTKENEARLACVIRTYSEAFEEVHRLSVPVECDVSKLEEILVRAKTV